MDRVQAMNNQKRYETPLIWPDTPVVQARGSSFDFNAYAITLARLIANAGSGTPITISISGAWGSGKTSLMQQVKSLLAETEKKRVKKYSFAPDESPVGFRMCRTVWFNAWKYNQEDHILAGLLRAIIIEMERDGYLYKLRAELEKREEKTDWLPGLLNAMVNFTATAATKIPADLKLDRLRQETPLKSATSFFDYFDESFSRLLACWTSGLLVGKPEIDEYKGVLVVFIDDLDRCLSDKVVQVMEAIKLFLDKKGCIFVLGADEAIIRRNIKNSLHFSEEDARDYLNKIIQVRFDLPPIQEKAMQPYIESAGELIQEEVKKNWERIVAGAEVNPRKVKAFINDLNLQWAILRNTERARGVQHADFTCWHIIRHVAPDKFWQQFANLPDHEIQYNFLSDALQWAKGTLPEEKAGFFTAYQDEQRLKKVLRKLEFSANFNAQMLKEFFYSLAPLAEAAAEAAPQAAESETAAPAVFAKPRAGEKGFEKTGENLRLVAGIPFVRIPAGKFILGSKEDDQQAGSDERPQQVYELKSDYWLAKYPVTNAQFELFVKETGYTTRAEKEGGYSPEKNGFTEGFFWRQPLGEKSSIADKLYHPVVHVSRKDALAFCAWLNPLCGSELPGFKPSLPSELEWEKAARGEYGNIWPWGNEFDPQHCNFAESTGKGTTAVGAFSPRGDSPYGAADMAGNVWEWTRSIHRSYPYDPSDGREDASIQDQPFVVRGGSFITDRRRVRCAYRLRGMPGDRYNSLGFRVVLLPI